MTLFLPLLFGLGGSQAFATSPPEVAAPADAEVAAPADAERDHLDAERRALREEMEALRHEVAELRSGPGTEGERRMVFGEAVSVQAGEHVDEVVSFGGDVTIEGIVQGDALSFGGSVLVEQTGQIGGDAVSFGGDVVVEDGGHVEGDRMTMAVPGALDLAPPAADEHHAAGSMPLATNTSVLLDQLYWRLVMLLSVAGAGVLVVGLFPTRVDRVARDLELRPVRAAVVGTLTSGFIALFSLLFILLTLGLGVPVSAFLMLVLGLAWLLGFVSLCQAVGDRLPLERKPHGRWLAFLIGVVLLTLVGSLPWIGLLVVGASSLLGIGAVVSTRFGATA